KRFLLFREVLLRPAGSTVLGMGLGAIALPGITGIFCLVIGNSVLGSVALVCGLATLLMLFPADSAASFLACSAFRFSTNSSSLLLALLIRYITPMYSPKIKAS